MGVAVLPAETDTPLVVNADAPLPGTIASQWFEAVPRRNSEEVKTRGAMKLFQLALCSTLGVLWQLDREPAVKELFRFFAGKGCDHG
jgi:hypothetical protein